jgi:hypothetical protein
MKKITTIIHIIAISISLLFASCIDLIAKEIKGDGKLVTKTITVSDFSKVKIEVPVKVNYSQGKSAGNLEFTTDSNLWEYYDIYTKNDVLYIKLKDEFRNNTRIKATKSLITISSEELDKIEIIGSGDIHFRTVFTSEKLSIDITGSGDIFANQYPIQIEDCSINITGSGDVRLAGNIQNAKIKITGSGDVKALDCEIAQLNISISGSGDVKASVTDKLDVRIAGSGDVKYKGNPEITTKISGSGKVVKL